MLILMPVEAEMRSMQHSWGIFQGLAEDREQRREFIAAQQDLTMLTVP